MRKVLSVWLVLLMVLAVFLPGRGLAEDELQRVVRVGWFDSNFNSIDAYGRRTGYAYEYQRKIAAYTGWQYEYVEDSWVDLLKKLQQGRLTSWQMFRTRKIVWEQCCFPNMQWARRIIISSLTRNEVPSIRMICLR